MIIKIDIKKLAKALVKKIGINNLKDAIDEDEFSGIDWTDVFLDMVEDMYEIDLKRCLNV